MNGLTCLDLFCGYGGLTLGIRESAFHSNFHCDEFATMKSQAAAPLLAGRET
ncbi:MAG: DNA cytosine methyltransferase [Verrucomicrobiaceae bacterium]|nr:MAG: DNA cytosine methyltransferase [Verrucomicrobiaceae bacterium]